MTVTEHKQRTVPTSGTVAANVLNIHRQHREGLNDVVLCRLYEHFHGRGAATDSSIRTRRRELVDGGLAESSRHAPSWRQQPPLTPPGWIGFVRVKNV